MRIKTVRPPPLVLGDPVVIYDERLGKLYGIILDARFDDSTYRIGVTGCDDDGYGCDGLWVARDHIERINP